MLCFRTVPVAKNVMDKEGERQKVLSINFPLTVPKKSAGRILDCFINFG